MTVQALRVTEDGGRDGAGDVDVVEPQGVPGMAAQSGCLAGLSRERAPEDSAQDALESSTQAVLIGSRIQAENWSSTGTTPGAVFNVDAGRDL